MTITETGGPSGSGRDGSDSSPSIPRGVEETGITLNELVEERRTLQQQVETLQQIQQLKSQVAQLTEAIVPRAISHRRGSDSSYEGRQSDLKITNIDIFTLSYNVRQRN